MSGVLKIFMITSPNLIILNILVYKIKPNFTKYGIFITKPCLNE